MRRPALARLGLALRDAGSLLAYLQRRRSLWISVLVVLLLVATAVLAAVQTAAVTPYVYTLF